MSAADERCHERSCWQPASENWLTRIKCGPMQLTSACGRAAERIGGPLLRVRRMVIKTATQCEALDASGCVQSRSSRYDTCTCISHRRRKVALHVESRCSARHSRVLGQSKNASSPASRDAVRHHGMVTFHTSLTVASKLEFWARPSSPAEMHTPAPAHLLPRPHRRSFGAFLSAKFLRPLHSCRSS